MGILSTPTGQAGARERIIDLSHFGLDGNIIAAKNPNTSAAVIPPEEAVSPPVNAPTKPFSFTAFATPLARALPYRSREVDERGVKSDGAESYSRADVADHYTRRSEARLVDEYLGYGAQRAADEKCFQYIYKHNELLFLPLFYDTGIFSV